MAVFLVETEEERPKKQTGPQFFGLLSSVTLRLTALGY
jgi:hypothetical protein